MPETILPAANPNPAEVAPSLIKEAGQEVPPAGSVIKDAEDPEKAAQLAEEDRILALKDEESTAEEKVRKTEILKARDEAKAKAEEGKKGEAPEKYEFKMPDGMTLDQAAADKITPVFKEIGLSQEKAQKLVDTFIEIRKETEAAQEKAFKDFNDKSYKDTIKSLGANYKQELAFVAKVRDRFFSEETQVMLDASGLANNKAFIGDIIKLGKLISEVKLADGKSAASGGANPASKLYPDQGKT